MSLTLGQNYNYYTNSSKKKVGAKGVLARVEGVVTGPYDAQGKLDKYFNANGGYKTVGAIYFTPLAFTVVSYFDYSIGLVAIPLNSQLITLPIRGELVEITIGPSQELNENLRANIQYYYSQPYNLWNNVHHNAIPDLSRNSNINTDTAPTYTDTKHGATNSPEVNHRINVNLGTYKERRTVKNLTPYEGDLLIQGRNGQSIRLGRTIDHKGSPNPWSKEGRSGDPILIIRNGQGKSQDIGDGWVPSIEDINTDPASIYMMSGQYIDMPDIKSYYPLLSYGTYVPSQQKVQTQNKIPVSTDSTSSRAQDSQSLAIAQISANITLPIQGCFVGDTMITLSDHSTVEISDIKVGDRVLTMDEKTKQLSTGEVLKKLELVKDVIVEYSYENDTVIKATKDHPIWVEGKGWCSLDPATTEQVHNLKCSLIEVQDQVVTVTGTISLRGIRECVEEGTVVYNITVNKEHTYFAQGILVHNKLAQYNEEDDALATDEDPTPVEYSERYELAILQAESRARTYGLSAPTGGLEDVNKTNIFPTIPNIFIPRDITEAATLPPGTDIMTDYLFASPPPPNLEAPTTYPVSEVGESTVGLGYYYDDPTVIAIQQGQTPPATTPPATTPPPELKPVNAIKLPKTTVSAQVQQEGWKKANDVLAGDINKGPKYWQETGANKHILALWSYAGLTKDSDSEAWCAAYCTSVLKRAGLPSLSETGNIRGSGDYVAELADNGRSIQYAGYGTPLPLDDPSQWRQWDIVVWKHQKGGPKDTSRYGKGHVGFLYGWTSTDDKPPNFTKVAPKWSGIKPNLIITSLGGNQSSNLTLSNYPDPTSDMILIAVVRPYWVTPEEQAPKADKKAKVGGSTY